MKTSLSLYSAACTGALLLSTTLRAEVPTVVSVQGQLGRISSGVATNLTASTQALDFRIYAGTNQSVTLFGRTNITVFLEQGKFSAEFGNGAALTNYASGSTYTNLPDLLADAPGSAFSLGMRLAGAASDFLPPVRLQSVPFALVAGDAKQATRTFSVRNGTATLGRLVVPGEVALKGPVTFEAGSRPVFSRAVAVAGEMKVTGGDTALSSLTVEGAASVSNATFTGIAVSNGTATVGSLTVASGMTTVTGTTSVDAPMTLAATNRLTVSGMLSATTLNTPEVTITSAFTMPTGAKIKRLFGERVCITTKVTTPPADASGWSNAFYQVTDKSYNPGYSRGYWRAPQDCFVVVNHVVGRYGSGEQSVKPIAVSTSALTTYDEIRSATSSIALTFVRLDQDYSYAAHKGAICLFMKKDQYLCWYSDYDNADTVFGEGYMRELSVLYFAN